MEKPVILAIVQARMGSTRLPGKVMKEIKGKPLIGYLLERLGHSKTIDKVIVATSVSPSDDPLCAYLQKTDVEVFRGSEEDVLDRFYRAAQGRKPETLVRLTADSPLNDPAVIDRTIEYFLSQPLDYVSNGAKVPMFPDGMDCEVFSFAALEKAWKEAKLPSEREHVTPYIKKPGLFRVGDYPAPRDYSGERWVVDNAEDLAVVSAVIEALYRPGECFGLEDVLAFKKKNPAIFELNKHIVRNEGYEKSLRNDRNSQ